MMLFSYLVTATVLALFATMAALKRKLTLAASVTGWVVSMIIFGGASYCGIALLAAFFVLGTMATSIGMRRKQVLGLAEKEKGRRTSGQVVANAGCAALLSLCVLFVPQYKTVLLLMLAASFSSAAADTLSSEIGNVYGRRFYNVVTFKKDQRGLDGVISLEGTLAGVAGSIVIAAIYNGFNGIGWGSDFLIIIVSGTLGNVSDSVLGATIERKQMVGNNAVNFLNTVVAAVVALLFALTS